MGMAEVTLAPRICVLERYDPEGQCTQAMDTLQQTVPSQVTSLKAKVDVWRLTGGHMSTGLKLRMMRATSASVTSFRCPMSLVHYDFSDLENLDFWREHMLNDIIEYEYSDISRRNTLIAKHFLPYASSHQNIFAIAGTAKSSMAAFSLAEDVKEVVCSHASWDVIGTIDRALKEFIPELSMEAHKRSSA